MKECTPFDLFPFTKHVETVCLLSKLHEAKHHVNVKLDMDEMDITSAERRLRMRKLRNMCWRRQDLRYLICILRR